MISALVIVGLTVVFFAAVHAEPRHAAIKPVAQWSEGDVGEWVRSLGPAFEAYAPEFVKNGVNGPALKAITPALLDNLGVKSPIHQHRLTVDIARLN